jgi:hypothetical protein
MARNTNCLVGMSCPQCKSKEPFKILVEAYATVYDDGTEDFEEATWLNESSCRCMTCHYLGTVDDFTNKRRKRS